MSTADLPYLDDLIAGHHADPFSLLGLHREDTHWRVVTFQPQASQVSLLLPKDNKEVPMQRIDARGVFSIILSDKPEEYRFAINENDQHHYTLDDAYRYASKLGSIDTHLFREGSHLELYRILGAHPTQLAGVDGVNFTLWAPNAIAVCVVGDFNAWHDARHPMRKHPATGLFDVFIPHATAGDLYQYRVVANDRRRSSVKSDPFAMSCEQPPAQASRIYASHYTWHDGAWMQQRETVMNNGVGLDAPMSIYEVHAGSWQRSADGQPLNYRELASQLIPYVTDLGFTHIEFMPLTAHPFDGSWGYQPIGLYAADPRYGDPDDLRYLIDACHQAGIGVIMDWVAAHFPRDAHGLSQFDGTCLYEHADPKRGAHPDWGTLEFNFGRPEVANYLLANAVFWIKEFHIDMLRVDAVASMLYLDYSREPGQWIPNADGGNQDYEAVAFIKRLNEVVHAHGGTTTAEESTAWPMVSRPTDAGGLGFTYKWNMGWMNDTLDFMGQDPVHRKHHHHALTFGLVYAFNENFVLPLSHDEVVHGKGSILDRMPGDTWQQFANVRLYYCFQYAHPGKKLLFMGNEFAQGREWTHAQELEWHLCDVDWHSGVQRLVKDLNKVYVNAPALHEVDFAPEGFTWLVHEDADNGVLAFIRWAKHSQHPIVGVFNVTPVTRTAYSIGVPFNGKWVECLNTDSAHYGGSNTINTSIETIDQSIHGQPSSVCLTLPGLSGLLLEPQLNSQCDN